MEALRSLDVVSVRVEKELATQLRHFEGLDAKAGIVLGFAGALVALGGRVSGLLADIGVAIAAAAALLGLGAFAPRDYPVLDLRTLRDRYVRADPAFATLRLLDTDLRMSDRAALVLARKGSRLTWAMRALAAFVLMLAVNALLH